MLPSGFLSRMASQLGAEYPDFLQSLERPRAVALRFNPRKGPRPSLPFLGEPVPWEPEGFYYDPDARPGLHPYHEAGVYYLQEASAMSAAALLDPQPGERVCDLCAAPGGKSTQIAGRMQGQGLLLCNEIHPQRAQILSRNVERMGIANALVTNETPERLCARFPGFFHRVLVDAPCSGEGMFRKEAAAVTDWSQETVEMCARRQLEILRCAGEMVRPGGRLVYSTCTFSPEENEGVIARFLGEHPEFSPEAVDAPWFTPAGAGQFRLWPHTLLGEGHFCAGLRRADGQAQEYGSCAGEPLPGLWTEFAHSMDIHLPEGKAVSFGQNLYWLPPSAPALSGLKVLRAGLALGEVRKGRLQPAHALALWMTECSHRQDYPADSAGIREYLSGNVLPTREKGWQLVSVDGYSLGWGKGDGNWLKNHYPKGLRRQF